MIFVVLRIWIALDLANGVAKKAPKAQPRSQGFSLVLAMELIGIIRVEFIPDATTSYLEEIE